MRYKDTRYSPSKLDRYKIRKTGGNASVWYLVSDELARHVSCILTLTVICSENYLLMFLTVSYTMGSIRFQAMGVTDM